MVGAEANHLCCRRDVGRAVGRVDPVAGHRVAHLVDHHLYCRAGRRAHREDHLDLGRDCRVGNRADCRGVDCHAAYRVGHRAVGLEDLGDLELGDFVGAVGVNMALGAAVALRSLLLPSFLPGSQHR